MLAKKLFGAVLICICVLANHVLALDFPLPKENFIPAKMAMHVVYPRPDNETQNHARHRWAYPGINYQIPVGVQGGAWPFKYELVQKPEGATIGEYYGDDDYGVINWVAPQSGEYTFAVRITDQEQSTIESTWKVTVDKSMFVFVQDGFTGSKKGTLEEPLEDISDWYKGDSFDDSFHNKILVFRGGNYTLIGDPDNNGNVRLNAGSKTPSLIAYPGEQPVVDASQAKVLTDNSALRDLFVAGIRWQNGRQDVANAHFFWAIGDMTRATWWRNHFDGLGPGQVGNDNTCAVFISGTDSLKTNILYKENLHTRINNHGYNGCYAGIYVSSYVLVEQNVARNSESGGGWHMKGTVSHVTVRANEAVEGVDGNVIGVGYGQESRQIPHHHEVCWNKVVLNTTSAQSMPLLWAHSNYYEGDTYSSYVYRNTFINGSTWIRFPGKEKYEVDGNLIVTDMESRWSEDVMVADVPNLVGGRGDSLVNLTGSLTGSYQDSYFGRVGAEVSDNNVNPPQKMDPPTVTSN